MKRLIVFQILLLCLGKYFVSDVSVRLPRKVLAPLLSKEISLGEIHLVEGKLVLKDVFYRTDHYKISCHKAIVLTYLPELRIQITGGLLRTKNFEIKNLCGIIGKKDSVYRAILSGSNSQIDSINLTCDKLVLNKGNLSDVQEAVYQIPTFSLRQLNIHIVSPVSVYSSLSGLKTQVGSIEKLQLESARKQDVYMHKFNAEALKCQDVFTGNIIGRFASSENFNELTSVVFSANGYCRTFDNVSIFGMLPTLSKKCAPANLCVENKDIKCTINSNNLWNKDIKCSHGYIQWTGLEKILSHHNLPLELSLKNKMFFSIRGVESNFYGKFFTKDIHLKDEVLSRIYADISVKDLNRFQWKVHFKGENTNPVLSGSYKLKEKKGTLCGYGYVKPELTYQLKDYLPDWWCSFFKDFRYHQRYPYSDFQLFFDLNTHTAITFGNAYVHNCDYKNTHLKSLNLTFGNQPGFCQITVNSLKTQKKHFGKFQIDWPYDKQNPDIEQWLFKGSGHFSIAEWRGLLEDFIGTNDNFKALDSFSKNSTASIKINGLMARQEMPKEFLDLHFYFPSARFSTIPVKKLNFKYLWNAKKTSITDIQGLFWNTSPVQANVDLKGKDFNFTLKAEDIYVQKLLQHPFFKTWKDAIPEENLTSYEGVFKLQAEGNGTFNKVLKVSGNGSIDLKNERLSQIHLLGPLSRLFSKRFKWQPNILFNQFVSDFAFTEKMISSNKAKLLGPSTRAEIQGSLDLDKQTVSAKIHFSFLDYKQMNFPIMKHFVQLFQPLSKGFSASVSGTFKNPQWLLTFNPFRFVFKRE